MENTSLRTTRAKQGGFTQRARPTINPPRLARERYRGFTGIISMFETEKNN